MTRHLAELCCGSAALTLHLHCAEPPMPYMGAKTRYAQAIAEAFGLERPDRALLVDTSMWAEAWAGLCSVSGRARVVALVRWLLSLQDDPRDLWNLLRTRPSPDDQHIRVSVWLVLQRLAYSGKLVRLKSDGTGWNDPGFQETAAYGRPAQDNFGAIAPQVHLLADKLEALPWFQRLEVWCCSAMAVPMRTFGPDWCVYIDPTYQGTTGYTPDDLTRAQVLELAERVASTGATVIVSEAESLVGDLPGWHELKITHLRTGKTSSWQREEWLTSNVPARQRALPLGAACG